MSEAESTQSVEERVKQILDEEIRPALRADGGDIAFVAMEGAEVKVQLRGACAGRVGVSKPVFGDRESMNGARRQVGRGTRAGRSMVTARREVTRA